MKVSRVFELYLKQYNLDKEMANKQNFAIVNRRHEREYKPKYFDGSYRGTSPNFTDNPMKAKQFESKALAITEINTNLVGTPNVASDYDVIPTQITT